MALFVQLYVQWSDLDEYTIHNGAKKKNPKIKAPDRKANSQHKPTIYNTAKS